MQCDRCCSDRRETFQDRFMFWNEAKRAARSDHPLHFVFSIDDVQLVYLRKYNRTKLFIDSN